MDGQPVPVTVRPNAKADPVALDISGPGFQMRLEGRGDTSDPLGLTSKQALVLESALSQRSVREKLAQPKVQPVAQSSGDGFMAKSIVKFYILPDIGLGDLSTDSNGVYNGRLPIPGSIPPGVYTLQANGYAPGGSVRSLSIGVLIKAPAPTRKAVKSTATVYFDALSPELTSVGKATLRSLVHRTSTGGVMTSIRGYVQPTTSTSNDQSLSALRARNVSAYLRSLGLKGTYVVRGDGIATSTGAMARRVNVTVLHN